MRCTTPTPGTTARRSGTRSPTDLVHWERVTDALVHGDAPAFDDLATWTGSVVRHPDGTWFMFYTGATASPGRPNVQRIGLGHLDRPDAAGTKRRPKPVLRGGLPLVRDGSASGMWHDEAWRDPFVFADPDGDGWHMLITARADHGPADDRGVIGHAWSADLRHWEVRPPLSEPGQGFGQLEVIQVEIVDGAPVLVFSSASRRGGRVPRTPPAASGPPGPIRCSVRSTSPAPSWSATPRCTSANSSAAATDGAWVMLAFHHEDADGAFVGSVSDPEPVHWDGRTLTRSARQPAPVA